MIHLVIGATGLVGSALMNNLIDNGEIVYGTSRTREEDNIYKMDLASVDDLYAVLDTAKPKIVYLCSSNTNVDDVEINSGAFHSNVWNLLVAINACYMRGIKVVFFSSSYVFAGEKPISNGGYSEKDDTYPLNLYGAYKLRIEKYIGTTGLVIRTVGVYGQDKKNFAFQVASGEHINIPSNQWMNPIHADQLADVATQLVDKNINGIVHVAGSQNMDKGEWADQLVRASYILDIRPLPFYDVIDMQQPAKRPVNGMLDTSYLNSLGIPTPDFQTGLMKFAKWYKNQQS